MPHLSPMAWIYFLIMLWFLMLITITNMWWLMMNPSMVLNNLMVHKKYTNWKW
uniref:ATP synthase F0 subunit 8 n=1 Tax=Torix tukubana TaxID=2291849 RepID=UPI00233F342B|nr:ATP synthase F0 subunit 8 [Torix tukubana]WBR65242.1 ATP synthase F0 subunit 8 [Torix tukubana]